MNIFKIASLLQIQVFALLAFSVNGVFLGKAQAIIPDALTDPKLSTGVANLPWFDPVGYVTQKGQFSGTATLVDPTLADPLWYAIHSPKDSNIAVTAAHLFNKLLDERRKEIEPLLKTDAPIVLHLSSKDEYQMAFGEKANLQSMSPEIQKVVINPDYVRNHYFKISTHRAENDFAFLVLQYPVPGKSSLPLRTRPGFPGWTPTPPPHVGVGYGDGNQGHPKKTAAYFPDLEWNTDTSHADLLRYRNLRMEDRDNPEVKKYLEYRKLYPGPYGLSVPGDSGGPLISFFRLKNGKEIPMIDAMFSAIETEHDVHSTVITHQNYPGYDQETSFTLMYTHRAASTEARRKMKMEMFQAAGGTLGPDAGILMRRFPSTCDHYEPVSMLTLIEEQLKEAISKGLIPETTEDQVEYFFNNKDKILLKLEALINP